MLFSLEIFTRNIKNEKVVLSISCNKGIFKKHLNTCYEHSNIEERNE